MDPFAGSGSTLAAAEALGYRCNGVEINREYYEMAVKSIPRLAELPNGLQQAFAAANWIDRIDEY